MREDLSWFKSSYSGSQGDHCLEVAYEWWKSSYSGTEGDHCVEARGWRKSTHSGTEGDSCVEVAPAPLAIHVRDSKAKSGPQLAFQSAAWADFLGTTAH